MIIRNARIVLEHQVVSGTVRIEGNHIAAISQQDIAPQHGEQLIDAGGLFVMPGIVDLHSHGSGGFDFMDGTVADITSAARSLALHGTTTCLPTTLTSSDDDLFLFLENFKHARHAQGTKVIAKMPGVHLEGPYFDMVEKGAQDPRYIRTPDKAHYMKVMEAADGAIKRWSVAPELDGAMQMIETLSQQGVLISGAHTAATYADIAKAYERGMKQLTHFYSGMSALTRRGGFRVLGTIESGYLIDDLYVELISDGMHLPPELLQLIFKCKRHDRITVCSDSMRGAGLSDGPSILGPKANGTAVIIEDGIAKMPDRTCFAGSVATGDRLARTLHKIVGLTMDEVGRIACLQPAKLIGMDDHIGSIAVGKRADLIICDDNITITSVFVDGKKV
jgi:N-acetylglucosamine-6-phosphate deacetylase